LQENFELWNRCLASGDISSIIQHYESKLTEACLGVRGGFIRNRLQNPDMLVDVHYTSTKGTYDNLRTIILSDDSYAHIGSYTTRSSIFVDSNSSVRFTYLWQRIGGKWLIVHFHCSLNDDNTNPNGNFAQVQGLDITSLKEFRSISSTCPEAIPKERTDEQAEVKQVCFSQIILRIIY
jgi:hypothetical protein